MEKNLDSCHVPQQSRRNKLRVAAHAHHPQPQSFSPISHATTAPPFEPVSIPEPSNPDPHFFQLLSNTSCSHSALHSFIDQEFPTNSHNRQPHVVSLSDQSQAQHNDLRTWVPMGPFTGYACILKRSRFLKPAQQLLEDFCGGVSEPPPPSPLEESLSENVINHKESIAGKCSGRTHHHPHQWRNSRLVSMLEEVCKKYILYCHQMQSVVAAFQKVAGLGNATPYIPIAIRSISKHFECLKHAIYDQLQFTRDSAGQKENLKLSIYDEQGVHTPKSVESLGCAQPSVLQNQRGLPNHAVAMLRTWLFEHFLHPYPSDLDKHTLAQQTGLSRSQVSNWFINARVRIWKPMVEEMHMLEKQQPQKGDHNATIPAVGPSTGKQVQMKTCRNQREVQRQKIL